MRVFAPKSKKTKSSLSHCIRFLSQEIAAIFRTPSLSLWACIKILVTFNRSALALSYPVSSAIMGYVNEQVKNRGALWYGPALKCNEVKENFA